MRCTKILTLINLISCCMFTYQKIVDIVRSKIENGDYNVFYFIESYFMYKIKALDYKYVIQKITRGGYSMRLREVYNISKTNFNRQKLDLWLKIILKNIFNKREMNNIKFLKFSSKGSWSIVDHYICQKLKDIDKIDSSVYNSSEKVTFNFIETENDILYNFMMDFYSLRYNSFGPSRRNIVCIFENDIFYLCFFVRCHQKVCFFKIDIQQLNLNDLYHSIMQDEIFQMKDFIKEDRANLDILQSFITIHDLLTLNLNADIYNFDLSPNHLKYNSTYNFNINYDKRKFEIILKKNCVIFKNLNQKFAYSFSSNLNLKIKHRQYVSVETVEECKNIFKVFYKLKKNTSQCPKFYYHFIKKENLLKTIIQRILRKQKSGIYLIFIHILGNLGILDLSEAIFSTQNVSISKNLSFNLLLDFLCEKQIEKIIEVFKKCENFKIGNLIKTIIFIEAEAFWQDYCRDKYFKNRLFDLLNSFEFSSNAQSKRSLLDIYKNIAAYKKVQSECMWETLKTVFEAASLVTNMHTKYKIKNKCFTKSWKEIKMLMDKLGIQKQDEINFILDGLD